MRRRRSVGPERSRGICATVAMRNLPFWGRHAPSNSGWQAQSEFECRNRNHAASGKLSAHATGLAVDVAGFDLANGDHLLVTEATDQAQVGVLRTLRTGACGWFTTILGPGTDAAHATHWHLDIMKHGSSEYYRICQ